MGVPIWPDFASSKDFLKLEGVPRHPRACTGLHPWPPGHLNAPATAMGAIGERAAPRLKKPAPFYNFLPKHYNFTKSGFTKILDPKARSMNFLELLMGCSENVGFVPSRGFGWSSYLPV